MLREGNADGKRPLATTPCSCHYEGRLIDGTVFDSSYKRGAPTTFAPNQVIKGWTEAMQLSASPQCVRASERQALALRAHAALHAPLAAHAACVLTQPRLLCSV